jgi:hypothetical protein
MAARREGREAGAVGIGRSLTLRWIGLCAAAEAVGMSASAAASLRATDWVDQADASRLAAGLLVVAGGLVEGLALALAQVASLRPSLPRLRAGRYAAATILIAGVGWAGGSLPVVLSGGETEAPPPLLLITLGGAGLGLVMGALMGGVQALALKHVVARPGVWVAANAAAWTPAMALMMLGASSPSEMWALPTILAWAALTGVLAGGALGLVLSRFVPALAGAPGRRDAK